MLALTILAGAALAVSVWLLVRLRRAEARAGREAEDAAREASERDQQLRAVVHERACLTGALEHLDLGVEVVDEAGRLLARNRAAERYHDALTMPAVVVATARDVTGEALRGQPAARTLPLFGPPRRTIAVAGFPLRVDGGLSGAVTVIHDATEAQRVDDVRRDFVANVTHELKTPIGALQLLAETIGLADDHETVQQLASRMVRESERLALIVDDLLSLSSIESGQLLERDLVPVSTIIRDSVERVASVAGQRGIEISVDVGGDPSIPCERSQATSAIANLIDNATKYSDAGGAVAVSVHEQEDRVGVRVADRGIGIPSSELERIFERFYRVDRARSRETGGTGLGLSIVRHVMQGHHGSVDVSSHEGEGSVFTLWFPRSEPAPALPGDVAEGADRG